MRETWRLRGGAGVCFLQFRTVSDRLGWRSKRAENAQPMAGCRRDLYRVEIGRLYRVEIVSRLCFERDAFFAWCSLASFVSSRNWAAGGVGRLAIADWLARLSDGAGWARRVGVKFCTENGSINYGKKLAVHRPDQGGFEIEERSFASLRMTSKPAGRVQSDRGADGHGPPAAGLRHALPLRRFTALQAHAILCAVLTEWRGFSIIAGFIVLEEACV